MSTLHSTLTFQPHSAAPAGPVRRRALAPLLAGTLLAGCVGLDLSAPPAPSADAYYMQGRAAQQAGRDVAALTAYRHALQLDPGHRSAGNGVAVLRAAQGDYGGAAALWRELLRRGAALAPADNAFVLRNLGLALLLDGDAAQAADVLQQACLAAPQEAGGWLQLARALAQLGQHERSARMLRQGQSLQRHDGAADAALAAVAAAPPPLSASAAPALADGVDGTLARIELVPSAGGVLRLRVVAPVAQVVAALASPGPLPVPGPGAAASASLPVLRPRLEIRNGNGVTGLAAALSKLVVDSGPAAVRLRLTNAVPFRLPRSHVEYQPQQEAAAQALAARLGLALEPPPSRGGCTRADICVVLGRDLGDGGALLQRVRGRTLLAPAGDAPPAG